MGDADGLRRRAPRTALICAVAAGWLGAAWPGLERSAQAAQFILADGATVDGEITRAAGGYLSIRTADGVRLEPLEAIKRVTVTDSDGETLSGALLGWSDGVYRISTAEGERTAREAAGAGDQAAAPSGATETATDAARTAAGEADGDGEEIVDPRMVSPQNVDREPGEVRIRSFAPKGLALKTDGPNTDALEGAPILAETDDPEAPAPPPATMPSPLAPADGIAGRVRTKQTTRAAEQAAPEPPKAQIARTDETPDLSALPAPRRSETGRSETPPAPASVPAEAPAAATEPAATDQPPSPVAEDGANDPAMETADATTPAGEAAAEVAAAEPPGATGATGATEAPVRRVEARGKSIAPPPSAAPTDAPASSAPQISAPPPLPRGAFAQLGPSNRGELRTVLKGIIHGGEGEAAQQGDRSNAAPDARERPPADRRASVRSAPARAAAAPQEAATGLGAPAPRSGPFDPRARALAETLSERTGVDACWSLAGLRGPLTATRAGGGDPSELRVSAVEEIPAAVIERLFASALAAGGAEPSIARTERGWRIAQSGGTAGLRLSQPASIRIDRAARSAGALASARRGRVDLGLALTTTGAFAPQQGVEAIAILPVVAVGAAEGPVRALSRQEIRGLLSGAISDWSMIDPTKLGAPRLYLPPVGSAAIRTLLDYAGLRRATPTSAVYVADPEARVARAVEAADGIAFALGAPEQGRIAPIDGRDDVSEAALRSGAYPLTVVMVRVEASGPAKHPLAASAALGAARGATLSAPEPDAGGVAWLGRCGAEGCAPSVAALRGETERPAPRPPLVVRMANGAAAGDVLARIALPKPDAADAEREVERALSGFLTRRASRPDWIPRALTLRMARRAGASTRVEAMGLALRCAGAPVIEAVLDPDSTLPADTLEVLAR